MIDFSGISFRLGLFYALRLENDVHYTSIFPLFVQSCVVSNIPNTNLSTTIWFPVNISVWYPVVCAVI